MIYAGFWKRLAAALLDLMIVIVPMAAIGIVTALVTGPKSTATAIADLSALAAFWLYFALMESSGAQATLGKLAFGMRVSDLRGNRVSFSRASGRFFAKSLSAISLGTGFLMAGATRRKQALHDKIANCLVIDSGVTPSDLRESGIARPVTAGGRAALALSALCVPLAAGGAAIAVPYYQDYVVRSRIGEAISSTRGVTADLAAYMLRYQATPPTLEEAHALASSPYVREAAIARDGSIVLTLAIRKLEGKRIRIVPSKAGTENIVWTCTSDEVAIRYLPQHCRH